MRYVLIALLLTACTSMTIWDKPGSTQQTYNQDSYACEKDARQSGYFGTGLAGSINMKAFFDQCMIARGWSKRQNQE